MGPINTAADDEPALNVKKDQYIVHFMNTNQIIEKRLGILLSVPHEQAVELPVQSHRDRLFLLFQEGELNRIGNVLGDLF